MNDQDTIVHKCEYLWVENDWSLQQEISYDEDGNPTHSLAFQYEDEYGNITPFYPLYLTRKMETTYQEGNRFETLIYLKEGNEWVLSSKQTHEVDSEEIRWTTIFTYEKGSWTPYSRDGYKAKNDEKLFECSYSWEEDTWKMKWGEKIEFGYNEQGQITSKHMLYWDDSENAWTEYAKSQYSYQDDWTIITDSTWNESNKEWVAVYQTRKIVYQDNVQCSILYNLTNNNWQFMGMNGELREYRYNEQGKATGYDIFQYKNDYDYQNNCSVFKKEHIGIVDFFFDEEGIMIGQGHAYTFDGINWSTQEASSMTRDSEGNNILARYIYQDGKWEYINIDVSSGDGKGSVWNIRYKVEGGQRIPYLKEVHNINEQGDPLSNLRLTWNSETEDWDLEIGYYYYYLDGTTDLKEINCPDEMTNRPHKVMRNGTIYIENQGTRYQISGATAL